MTAHIPKARTTALLLLVLATAGCSTGTWFKLPENSTITINERAAIHDEGLVYTRPYSWGAASGIPYKIKDGQSRTIKQGRLKSRFRVPSIFWPPGAIAYWPMGFGQKCYDMTGEAPQTCTYQDFQELRANERMRR